METAVRERRLLFAGRIMPMGDERLLKIVLLGEAVWGGRSVGGQERDWVRRIDEDLLRFKVGDEKEEGKWKTSAEDMEEWYTKVEGGAEWFMRRWHSAQAEESGGRQARGGGGWGATRNRRKNGLSAAERWCQTGKE